MNTATELNGILRQYLLGDLGAESREQLEFRLIAEQEIFDELLRVEDDLADEYVRNDLTPAERERFESLLQAPQRRRQVEFAAALRRHVETVAPDWQREERQERPRPTFMGRLVAAVAVPAWQPAMAAALTVLLVGAGWLIVANRQLVGQLDTLATNQSALETRSRTWEQLLTAERGRSTSLDEELAATKTQNASLAEELEALRAAADRRPTATTLAAVATLWLQPGLLRSGGDTERLLISAETRLVRLQLDLGIDDYASYRASLHDAAGDELWSQSKLGADTVGDRVAVVLTLPAGLLPRGDYSVRLSGAPASGDPELIGRYYLRVLTD